MKAVTYTSALERLREVFGELYAPKTNTKEELDTLERLVSADISKFAESAAQIDPSFLSQEDMDRVWFKDLMADTFDTFIGLASLRSELAEKVHKLG